MNSSSNNHNGLRSRAVVINIGGNSGNTDTGNTGLNGNARKSRFGPLPAATEPKTYEVVLNLGKQQA